MENKKKAGSSIGGIALVGFMFLGAGIGMIFNKVQIGGAIGMGIGFIAMASIIFYYNRER
ncbi:MAG: hypothetical protein H0V01_13075 [Bacteroidetes bacterium]|nr:hypothetical protein [Bacteroidota bacterium]HET6245000.1 hypothetical protein [Bacteroidia bacterium]